MERVLCGFRSGRERFHVQRGDITVWGKKNIFDLRGIQAGWGPVSLMRNAELFDECCWLGA